MRWPWASEPQLSSQDIQDIADIYSRFGISVNVRTDISINTLPDLYDALDTMHNYYGIEPLQLGLNGLSIVIEKKVYIDDKTQRFRKHEVAEGIYDPETDAIYLAVDNLDALVHEFIHAVDYAFCADDRTKAEPYSNLDIEENRTPDGIISFLRERHATENDIMDFQNTFKRMRNSKTRYLSTPSEILARMGEYSFLKDNASECERNPFLHISCNPYSISERVIVNQYPFHSIAAVRQFIHHAIRDIAKEPPSRWIPPAHCAFMLKHSAEWYRNAWDELYEKRTDISLAETSIQEAQLTSSDFDSDRKIQEKTQKTKDCLSDMRNSLKKNSIISMNQAGSPELVSRVSVLIPDSSKVDAIISYLAECRDVAIFRERDSNEKRKHDTRTSNGKDRHQRQQISHKEHMP